MINLYIYIKNRLISLYQDYKYESMIFKQTEINQPVWEKNLAWLLLIAFIFFLIFNSYIFTNEVNIFLLIYLFFSVVLLYNSAKREFKNVKNYYILRKQHFNDNFLLKQKRFIFTSFTFIKLAKPAVKTCFACFIGINGAVMTVHGTHKMIWPEQKSPLELLGTKITEHTGYPPESWNIKNNEINTLKEQLNNKDDIIKELKNKLENDKK